MDKRSKIALACLILAVVIAVYTYAPKFLGPTKAKEEYKEYFDKGLTHFREGDQFLSQAKTEGELGNYGEAASLSTKAEEEFETAELWFSKAVDVAFSHDTDETGVKVMTEYELKKVENYNVEHGTPDVDGVKPQELSTAAYNRRCSQEMSIFSGYLSDDFIKAEKDKRLLENILSILKLIL